jgi:hypothetical protein
MIDLKRASCNAQPAARPGRDRQYIPICNASSSTRRTRRTFKRYLVISSCGHFLDFTQFATSKSRNKIMVDTEDITGGMAPNQTKEQASLVKNVDPEAADDHDDDDNDVLDKELDKHLKHNTFSLIYTAELTSSAFALAMFFALFQIALPVMALLDLIQFNNVKNPLKVPNDVSLAVRITGLMCLLLAIPLFWDLMDAIERLQQGPPPRSEQPVGGIPCG